MNVRALWLVLLVSVLAVDANAQRRRFGGRRPGNAAPEAAREATPVPDRKKVEHWLAVTGADVYFGTGQLLRRATVLLGDDKIHAVGHDLELPEGTQELDARGKVVAPGYVSVRPRGLGGAPSSGDDELADAVNPYHPDLKLGLAAGITAFLNTYGSGTDKPGGHSALVKAAVGDAKGMVVARDTVFSMRVPLDPSKWSDLREAVQKAKDFLKAEAEARGKPAGAEAPKPPQGSDELLKVLRGEAMLWVSAAGPFDSGRLQQALELAKLLGRGVVLDSPVTAWAMPDEVAATESMVALCPRDRFPPDPGRPADTGSNLAAAALLNEAGVGVAIFTPSSGFGIGAVGRGGILGQDLHTLPLDAAFAVRGGMDESEALRTITLDAARAAGVDQRLGSIEPGKDADLLILGGDPLHYATFVETAIVNGKVVYQKDKEPFYSNIPR